MYLNPTQMLSLTGQQIPGNILQRRNAHGSDASLDLADFHEKSARLLDYASLAAIACPGAFVRWGVNTLAKGRFGARLASRMVSNAPGRFTLSASRAFHRGLSSFLTTTPLGRGVAMFAENNFAKALLLGGTQLYRNPSTLFPPSGNSLHELFIEDEKWMGTLVAGYALFRLSKYLLGKWPVGMDLALKTAFTYSAARHHYNRMNLSEEYYAAISDRDYNHIASTQHRLRNMAAESMLFGAISGFAAFNEGPLGKAACAIDDVLPDIVERLKILLGGRPAARLASQ